MNALRSVLVHLDGSPRAAERLRVARALASAQGATVTAMLAVNPALVEVPLSYMGEAGGAVLLQEAEAQRRRDARALFDRENAEPGPLMRWREAGAGLGAMAFADQALYADLMVLGQHDRQDPLAWGVPADFPALMLLHGGRPALVVPHAGHFTGTGLRIVVAWKPMREAARAVTAALPLLQAAQQVNVVTWEEAAAGRPSAEGLGEYLALHGVQPRWEHGGPAGADVGDLLLSRAADLDADLLVMGAYSHTRAREWLLGGATRTVLQSMTVPVLMSH